MPTCENAELFFTALIGSLTIALLFLALREDFLRLRGR
jgi:hypothetical protein